MTKTARAALSLAAALTSMGCGDVSLRPDFSLRMQPARARNAQREGSLVAVAGQPARCVCDDRDASRGRGESR